MQDLTLNRLFLNCGFAALTDVKDLSTFSTAADADIERKIEREREEMA